MGLQVTLTLPWRKPGEPQRGDGAFSNTPPKPFRVRPSLCTRATCEACAGKWRGGKREPNESPEVLTGGGWGIGVGARESRGHQDEDGWRRPLAFAKTGPKGRSERASCPRVDSWGAEAMGRDAERMSPLRVIGGAKPGAVKAASPVLNGGDEETGLVRPCLVATQLECAFCLCPVFGAHVVL